MQGVALFTGITYFYYAKAIFVLLLTYCYKIDFATQLL